MNQTAANLVDRVLPHVPIRQWVLSFPMPLRLWLARRPELRQAVLGVFLRVVFGFYRRQARAAGHADPRSGAVCFHQHFGSSLNLNLHFHLLALDVEGHEPEIIKSLGDFKPEAIFYESHNLKPGVADEVSQILKDRGYRLQQILGDTVALLT